jgi:hypothetical protein
LILKIDDRSPSIQSSAGGPELACATFAAVMVAAAIGGEVDRRPKAGLHRFMVHGRSHQRIEAEFVTRYERYPRVHAVEDRDSASKTDNVLASRRRLPHSSRDIEN